MTQSATAHWETELVLDADDQELIAIATELISRRGDGVDHTVAAAARDATGTIHTGVNLHHFTGGPCAEVVAIAVAVSSSSEPLTTIVAVGDRGRGVLSPCGRCRQIMADYFPELRVIVPGEHAVPVAELLPFAYTWPDRQEP
jgi:cytidine deaminase